MSDIVCLYHLPGLRLGEGSTTFAGASLYELPFEEFDALTSGAFDGRRRRYEATRPVFLAWELDMEVETSGEGRTSSLQLKLPSHGRPGPLDAGLGGLVTYMDDVVGQAWAALSLACPPAAPIAPWYSTGFLHVQGGGHLRFQDQRVTTVQVQGDADLEYLFGPDLASDPLPEALVRDAEGLVAVVGRLREDAHLSAALDALLGPQSPAVTPRDHLVLSVLALEGLLLEGRTSGLRAAFAEALAEAVELSAGGLETQAIARALYDIRSAELHGRPEDDDAGLVAAGAGPTALAGTLVHLGAAAGAAEDGGGPGADPRPTYRLEDAPSRRPADRLNRGEPTIASNPLGTMHADDDAHLLWSPCIGLQVEGDGAPLSGEPTVLLLPLDADEITELEDRDVRQDFLRAVQARERLRKAEEDAVPRSSVLMTPGPEGEANLEALASALGEIAGRAVLALRMEGFHGFVDPHLLGSYLYAGKTRFRVPTVFRQTVLNRYGRDAELVDAAGAKGAASRLAVLQDVLSGPVVPGLAATLALYRRAHQAPFVAEPVCAGLAVATLERLLGRFHDPRAADAPEVLAPPLVGGEDGAWFAEHGRALRNDVAHGRFDAGRTEDLARLLRVVGRVLAAQLDFLRERGEVPEHPTRAFVEHLANGGGNA